MAEYINGRATKPSELCGAGGVPVIKIAELNRGITDKTDRIPAEVVSAEHWIHDGDLLFAWSGSVGVYRYRGPKAALNQHIFKVIAKPGFDQDFLRYLLLSQLPIFLTHVKDKKTTMGHVTIRDLQRITVRVPPLPEQRAIAHILGTLDDKIELLRRMSETLEQMARALFKSWFVDFDPVVVNALRAGNPIPDKFAARAAYYRQLLNYQNLPHSPLPLGEGLGVRVSSSSPPKKSLKNEEIGKTKLPPKLLSFARELRKNQTDAESLLWNILRNRQFLGIKFRRQHPIPPYIVDFFAHELGLVIEIDGGQHAEPRQKAYDEKRTAFLEEKGLTVIRYWANDILRETEAVLQDLYERVLEMMPSPQPSPGGRGRRPSPPAPLPLGEGSILPEYILRLFPARFVESELGPIPEGWEVKALPDITDIVLGGTPKTSVPEYWNGEILWASAKDISNASDIFILKTERTITRLGLERSNAKLLPAGTTVITSRGTVGQLCILGVDMAINQTNYGLVPHPDVDKYFVYLAISDLVKALKQRSYGTIFETITTKTLSEIKVLYPTENVMNSFGNLVSDLMENIHHNILESESLAALRDTLLPKLISGELRVPDVERFLREGGL